MNYKIGRHPLVFGTLEEAKACAEEIFRNTGIIVSITETEEIVTHIYEKR